MTLYTYRKKSDELILYFNRDFMIENDSQKIQALFWKYTIDGCVNIYMSSSKDLEYSPLHDEISLDSSENIHTDLTVIKNHKKAVFWIDGYSLEKIEKAIQDTMEFIEFAEFDEDIILPQITDSQEKDFSTFDSKDISFQDLKNEFLKCKNFPFEKNISIEAFSIWVSNTIHYYINSLWSVKIQKDNGAFYYLEIFGENNEKRETHYKYTSTKEKPMIEVKMIQQLQQELLFKISDSQTIFHPWVYDITLDRDVVIDFLDVILWNLWAESMREWVSLFSKNKLWDKIFSTNFTLINNPDLKNYTGNLVFDKEWITAKKTILFDKWVLNSKFYDYKNALKEWLQYLWNSSISNIEFEGAMRSDYLFGSKILFTNLMAFHTVDAITGKFSLQGEWYILENGEKKDYIKNINLSGDIIHLFSHIKCLWDDYKTDGNFRVPSISFQDQKIV